MNKLTPLNRRVTRREVIRAVIAASAAALFIWQGSLIVIEAQRRQTPRRRAVKARAPSKTGRDYSVFKHEDHRKGLECSSCHTIPSPAQPDRVAAATRPNAVSSYPYHDSCFRCHRQEIYRGDRPAICTVCHSRVSPRATPRDVYSQFPGPKRGDIMAREFPGYFPHGLHQTVMALHRSPKSQVNAGLRLLRVSFNARGRDEPGPRDICAACHFTDERGPVVLPLLGIQSEETFKKIEADTFKTIPGYREANAHASCFNCHWEAQKPTRDDCNGCHLARSDYTARALHIIQQPALSSNAMTWFKDWPIGLPKRFSLKFRHNTHTLSADGKSETNNHDVGCTTCHINIAQMTTLNIPKADVQIISCAPCHTATSAIPVSQGVRVTIFDEMALKGDTSKNYTCVACHTSVVGRQQPPCTHYSVIGEPCPKLGQSAIRQQ